jgi:hypothetical protein
MVGNRNQSCAHYGVARQVFNLGLGEGLATQNSFVDLIIDDLIASRTLGCSTFKLVLHPGVRVG